MLALHTHLVILHTDVQHTLTNRQATECVADACPQRQGFALAGGGLRTKLKAAGGSGRQSQRWPGESMTVGGSAWQEDAPPAE